MYYLSTVSPLSEYLYIFWLLYSFNFLLEQRREEAGCKRLWDESLLSAGRHTNYTDYIRQMRTMLVYIKVSSMLIHLFSYGWITAWKSSRAREVAALQTNTDGLHVHSWQQQRMPEIMLGIYPQLHDCPQLSAQSYINLIN